ncbi:glycosyltransferase family 4 protein [Vibrio metschnikovii]|uniref:glycosyltransferase family 4 protein n=1 Tax=Vibrio metschnikovii TaxID=28172 RepID=UPI001C2FB621|nr:glycosyltransferase [Vibrio metschnikovii]
MRLLFVHDHIFCKTGNLFFSDKLPYNTWLRYLEFFDYLSVFSRYKTGCIDSSKSSPSSGDNVNFIPAENISTLKSYLGLRTEQFERLKNAILESDAVVARLPSEYGIAAVNLAHQLGKPVMAEVVSCAWDSLWNNGSIKAKLYAPYLLWKMKKSVKLADFSLYVSNVYLQQRYPTQGKSIGISDVALNDFPESILNRKLKFFKNNVDSYKIGLIGSFKTRYKGIDVAIKAVAELIKSDIKVTLHILGSGDIQPYQTLAKQLNVQDYIFFEGTLAPGAAVFSWLDEKDIYIQPSLVEGMPRAVLEAMSRALPVVATNVGGLPEIIDDNFLAKPKSSKALANKISVLINDNDLRRSQIIMNFKKSQDFSSEKLDLKRRNFFELFYKEASEASLI